MKDDILRFNLVFVVLVVIPFSIYCGKKLRENWNKPYIIARRRKIILVLLLMGYVVGLSYVLRKPNISMTVSF